MTPLELVRVRWDAPGTATERLTRTGTRVAGVGLAALGAAGRLARLRNATVRDGARERALVLRDVSRRILELHAIELTASGPLPLGPAVLASNHVSWLDPLVVASILPCVPISKVDLSGWPVIGSIARDLGVVFVSRGDPMSGLRVLRLAEEALAHGLPVLNFPEGTTSTGASVLPFRKGLFGIAHAARVPVVPIAIAYDPPELAWVGDDSFLPHWLGLAGARRARAFVRLGPAILLPAEARAHDVARAAHAEVSRLLQERP